MTFLYLDASAWVKHYYRERGTDRIHELLAGKDPRVCSVLGLVEVVATLARKRRAREITPEAFSERAAAVQRDWQTFLQIELTRRNLNQARAIAASTALRGADAVHFAALLSIRQRVSSFGHRVVLVASDAELLAAAETSGIPVIDPEVST